MQQFLEAANIALQAIWANKLRSLLTVIGNVVAVTSIIAVVSLVQGLNASVKDAIQSQVGADSFAVTRNPVTFTQTQESRAASNPRITLDDAEALRAFGGHIKMVMAEAGSSGTAKYRSETLDSIRIRGVTKEYTLLSTTRIERGRPITPREFEDGRPVAVVGWGTADRLFGVIDPLDKTITLAGIHFKVVGVAEKKGAILGQSQDEFAIVPLAAYQKIFGMRQSLQLTVTPTDPTATKVAMDDATVAMRIQRKLRPADKDNFGVTSSDTFLDLYNQVTSGIFAILLGVVSLSLVVGGIVIMNIMLMVVTERTREIGLRKSLGARRRDVLWQILTESITLSTFGGVVGTVLGAVFAVMVSKVSPLPASVQPWAVVTGIGITAVVCLFFGMYPAMRAAKLDPIEALRRD